MKKDTEYSKANDVGSTYEISASDRAIREEERAAIAEIAREYLDSNDQPALQRYIRGHSPSTEIMPSGTQRSSQHRMLKKVRDRSRIHPVFKGEISAEEPVAEKDPIVEELQEGPPEPTLRTAKSLLRKREIVRSYFPEFKEQTKSEIAKTLHIPGYEDALAKKERLLSQLNKRKEQPWDSRIGHRIADIFSYAGYNRCRTTLMDFTAQNDQKKTMPDTGWETGGIRYFGDIVDLDYIDLLTDITKINGVIERMEASMAFLFHDRSSMPEKIEKYQFALTRYLQNNGNGEHAIKQFKREFQELCRNLKCGSHYEYGS